MGHIKRYLIVAMIAIFSIGLIIWASFYYNEKVFYLNQHKYMEASSATNQVVYTSDDNNTPTIYVTDEPGDKEITISGEKFIIKELETNNLRKFEVHYRNGDYYTVETNGLTYDKDGEIYWGASVYVGGKKVLSSGEPSYYPSTLVTIAYPEFHEKQGSFTLFIVAIIVFILGLVIFTQETVQLFLFYLSHGLDVVDPEPSDFYFFTTKASAVVVMILGVVVFFKSL